MSARRVRFVVRVVAAVLVFAGTVAMLAGTVTRWATVSADPEVFAAALHEDVAVILPAIRDSTGVYTWLEGDTHGDVVWLTGLAILGLGGTIVARATRPRGSLIAGLGVLAGWVALANAPDAEALRREAVRVVAPWAYAAHVDPSVLASVYTVIRGPSTAVVPAGALAVIVGGVLVASVAAPDEDTDWIGWKRLRSEGRVADRSDG